MITELKNNVSKWISSPQPVGPWLGYVQIQIDLLIYIKLLNSELNCITSPVFQYDTWKIMRNNK